MLFRSSWEDFLRYWDRMCREVLEDNKATRDVLDLSHLGRPPFLRWMPASVWAVLQPPVTHGFLWLTIGLYDPAVRDLLGYTFSRREQRLHRLVGRSIGLGEKLVPRRYRYHPRARAGWDRARGRVPADAPVVERAHDHCEHYNVIEFFDPDDTCRTPQIRWQSPSILY